MNAAELKDLLAKNAADIAAYLFPDGKRAGREWKVGSVNGEPGLWIGFVINGDANWLRMDPSRLVAASGRTWLIWLSIAALLAHGTALYLQLITASGLNLDFFNAASLIAAAVILLTLLACRQIPVENLLLLLLPLGALTALMAQIACEVPPL